MTSRESSAQPDSGGSRPEQVFFEDPALDRMMGVILALATEHCVVRDRLQLLESVLATRGLLDPDLLDAASTSGLSPAQQEETAAFVEALMRPLLGVQQATGATGPFSLANRRTT